MWVDHVMWCCVCTTTTCANSNSNTVGIVVGRWYQFVVLFPRRPNQWYVILLCKIYIYSGSLVRKLAFILFSHIGDAMHRWPQASPIYCSEVNIDSSLLAVGLTSGCVALWNLVTCELWCVILPCLWSILQTNMWEWLEIVVMFVHCSSSSHVWLVAIPSIQILLHPLATISMFYYWGATMVAYMLLIAVCLLLSLYNWPVG